MHINSNYPLASVLQHSIIACKKENVKPFSTNAEANRYKEYRNIKKLDKQNNTTKNNSLQRFCK